MEEKDALAKVLYEAYCAAVGGHSAVTNEKLPTWEELKKDDKRGKVVEGWRAVAVRARQPESAFAVAPEGGTADSNSQLSVEGPEVVPPEPQPETGSGEGTETPEGGQKKFRFFGG